MLLHNTIYTALCSKYAAGGKLGSILNEMQWIVFFANESFVNEPDTQLTNLYHWIVYRQI